MRNITSVRDQASIGQDAAQFRVSQLKLAQRAAAEDAALFGNLVDAGTAAGEQRAALADVPAAYAPYSSVLPTETWHQIARDLPNTDCASLRTTNSYFFDVIDSTRKDAFAQGLATAYARQPSDVSTRAIKDLLPFAKTIHIKHTAEDPPQLAVARYNRDRTLVALTHATKVENLTITHPGLLVRHVNSPRISIPLVSTLQTLHIDGSSSVQLVGNRPGVTNDVLDSIDDAFLGKMKVLQLENLILRSTAQHATVLPLTNAPLIKLSLLRSSVAAQDWQRFFAADFSKLLTLWLGRANAINLRLLGSTPMPSLRELWFSGDPSQMQLSQLQPSQWPQLRRLTLHTERTGIAANMLKSLLGSRTLPSLRILDIEGPEVAADVLLLVADRKATTLQHLSLSGIDDLSFSFLQLRHLSGGGIAHLHSLTLTANAASLKTLTRLLGHDQLPVLRDLSIHAPKVSADLLAVLGARQTSKLRSLTLPSLLPLHFSRPTLSRDVGQGGLSALAKLELGTPGFADEHLAAVLHACKSSIQTFVLCVDTPDEPARAAAGMALPFVLPTVYPKLAKVSLKIEQRGRQLHHGGRPRLSTAEHVRIFQDAKAQGRLPAMNLADGLSLQF